MRLLLLVATFLLPQILHAQLSLEEKIGQMLMIGFNGIEASDPNVIQIGQDIDNGKIGGVLFFARNIESPAQLKDLTSFLKSFDSPPFKTLFAIDQEGGRVQRLKELNGFTTYLSAKKVCTQFSVDEALDYYTKLAEELATHNFCLNLGPVVDLDYPESPAIGKIERSFHNCPEQVAKYAQSFIDAHSKMGVKTCLKHFPGHGSARRDTHLGLTNVSQYWTEAELHPFKSLKDKNCAIMSSHIVNANLDPELLPASLSPTMLQSKLRDEIGFDGVIISDCLLMNAIWNEYPFEEIVKKAILAGNDILIFGQYYWKQEKFPESSEDDNEELGFPEKFRNTVLQLIQNGTITEERIEASYQRIIRFKNQ